jgi:hypothetical protein
MEVHGVPCYYLLWSNQWDGTLGWMELVFFSSLAPRPLS